MQHSRSLSFICLIYSNLYLHVPNSQLTPPRPHPRVPQETQSSRLLWPLPADQAVQGARQGPADRPSAGGLLLSPSSVWAVGSGQGHCAGKRLPARALRVLAVGVEAPLPVAGAAARHLHRRAPLLSPHPVPSGVGGLARRFLSPTYSALFPPVRPTSERASVCSAPRPGAPPPTLLLKAPRLGCWVLLSGSCGPELLTAAGFVCYEHCLTF